MNNNLNQVPVRNNKNGLTIVLSMIIIILIGGFAYLYLSNINCPKCKTCQTCDKEENQLLTKTQATTIANQVYSDAYDKINEGQSLIDISKTYSKHYVNNVLSCYKLNFSTITNIFTDKGLAYIKNHYSDPVETENDDNYYMCNTYTSNLPELMMTIFGVTDQGKRNLIVVDVTSDTIIATGQLSQNGLLQADKYPLYIIFKKSGNNWLIDSFE